MTASIRATSSATIASGTSAVVTKPTGTADDDVLVVALYIVSDASLSVPSGWTQKDLNELDTANSAYRQYIFWKRASSEGANWTWSWSGSADYEWQCAAVQGAHTAGDPFNATAVAERDNTSSDVIPNQDVVTTVDDTFILASMSHGPVSGSQNNGAHSTPSGITEDLDNSNHLSLGHGTQATAGTFSAGSSTMASASNSTASIWLGAIKTATVTREQEGYRWRADDGSETTATWLAAQDTNITRTTGTNTRLRILMDTASADPPSEGATLEYKKTTDSVHRKIEAAGGGAIATGTAGTVSSGGTTSISVAYPASPAKGDLILMFVANRPNANTPDDITGWDKVTTTGGAGSEGAGTGTVRETLYIKKDADGRYEAAGTESGSVTVSCTSGSSMFGRMVKYSKTTGKQWNIATATGSDNSAGTSGSWTAGSDPGLAANDFLVLGVVNSEDTARAASEAVSATGCTFGTMTEIQDSGITTGNDLGLVIADFPVSTGPSSAAPVFTLTWSGTNSANSAGPGIFVRIRQDNQPIQLSASANITASGANTTGQLSAPASGSFGGGRIQDDENPTDAVDLSTNGYREDEFCLTATSAASGTYEFRLTIGGVALDTYSVTPQWTIGTGINADVPVGLLNILGVAPATTKQAAIPVGLLKFTGVAPGARKNLAVPIGLLDLLGTSVTTAKAAAVVPGLIDLLGVSPLEPQRVDVPAGIVAFAGITPAATKQAAVPAASVHFLGVSPQTAKLASVAVGGVDFLGVAPSTAKSAAVPAGLVDLAGLAPTTTHRAAVPAGAVLFTGNSPEAGINASVPVGRLALAALAPSTAKSAAVPTGSVVLVGLAPSTPKSAAVPAASVEILGIAPEAPKSASVPASSVSFLGMVPSTAKSVSVDVGVIEIIGVAIDEASVTIIDVGLEWTLPESLMDYTLPPSIMDWVLPNNLMDWTLPNEDDR